QAWATCPKCHHRFQMTNDRGASTVPASPKMKPATLPTVRKLESSPASPSLAATSLQTGGARAKTILCCFLLLVALLVGVRLWADAKQRNVPFPNFIATSAREVAVSWGEQVYLLDHAGTITGKLALPPGTILTQLAYVGDELWLADHKTNAIKRLHNGAWETVVNGAGRFRGAYKFAADLEAGEIFVTDSSNHIIHQFTSDGTYQHSFGREGKGPGDLMFPNSILFDQAGNLIVANTNCFRLDLFSRHGDFLKTIAHVQAIGMHRFPTLLTEVGEKFAFLHTVDLRAAKVMLYGGDGNAIGELVPPKPIDDAGDIAAMDGNILVSDHQERKVYRFSADTREYLGPFSAELEQLGMADAITQRRYQRIANFALVIILVTIVPLLFFYLRFRRL